MIALLQNILLALIWAALRGDFSPANVLLGFLLGTFLLWLGRSVTGRNRYFEPGDPLPTVQEWLQKCIQVPRFILVFLYEVLVANIKIAVTVLKPGLGHIKPAIIALPIELGPTDEEIARETARVEDERIAHIKRVNSTTMRHIKITMLANMITLTPGTLSLDVSDNERVIYVHCVDADDPDQVKHDIKSGFETLVREVFE